MRAIGGGAFLWLSAIKEDLPTIFFATALFIALGADEVSYR